MNLLEDIFAEYVAKRKQGMSSNEVLNILRPYIDPLAKSDKSDLAEYVRTFEQKQGARLDGTESLPSPLEDDEQPPSARETSQSQVVPQASKIKSLGSSNPRQTITIKSLKDQESAWITCSNCDAKNRRDSVFCYTCGHLLEQAQGRFGTRKFKDADTSNLDSAYFGPDSLLVLRIRDEGHDYELRPQLTNHEMVIGRGAANSAMVPDIDLGPHNGEALGVSRLHMGLRYSRDDQAIQVYDLGSANGSFVNGQKVHQKEVRILRDGDQLRIGKLVLLVNYYHPGAEIH